MIGAGLYKKILDFAQSHFPEIYKLTVKFRYELKFLFVGVLNTAVGLGTYCLFVYLGIPYMLSLVFSNVIGTLHSYLWNKFFTFKSKSKSFAEFFRFICVYLVSFALNAVILYLLVQQAHFSKYWGGAVTTFVCMLISFFGHKFFSFKKTGNA